jgi:hypothetical protein
VNAFFHTLTGIGIGHAVSSKVAQGTPLKKGCAGVAAFGLAILSHGILDGLKHLYPFRPETDLFFSLLLMGAWCLRLEKPYRWLFALTIFGSLLPDLLDHGPDLLNVYLGWHLPTHAKWFPWHQPGDSGSLYHGEGAFYSWTNHLIVISFNAAAILFNRQGVLRPFRRPSSVISLTEGKG